MKKLIAKLIAWALLALMTGGFTYLALIMWAYEIEHCFGM